MCLKNLSHNNFGSIYFCENKQAFSYAFGNVFIKFQINGLISFFKTLQYSKIKTTTKKRQ